MCIYAYLLCGYTTPQIEVEYIECISVGVSPPHPTSVLDMTLNHQMVRLLPWRFGKCRVPLHCYCYQVHSVSADMSIGILQVFHVKPGSLHRTSNRSRIHWMHRCRGKSSPPNECPVMTFKHLMVRLLPWRFRKCRVQFYCYCYQVHSDQECKHMIGSYLWNKLWANKWPMLNSDCYIAIIETI